MSKVVWLLGGTMFRFIVVTLGFLGWAFFELSGGTEFEPRVRPEVAEARAETAPAVPAPEVTRSATAMADAPEPSAKPAPIPARPGQPGVTLAALETTVTRPRTARSQSDGSGVSLPAQLPATPEAAPEPAAPIRDIRSVTGNRVNMRNGPGTNYSVIARLERGMEVEVLQEPGNQWVKLRVLDTNRVGWMADWLITAPAE